MFTTKRAYDAPAARDGQRILVDRLWPRGLKKSAAAIDAWKRDLAPSDVLRKWFGHKRDRWTEFARRYRGELRRASPDELRALARAGARRRITLVFSAKDAEHNQAVVLKRELERLQRRSSERRTRAPD